MNFRFTTSGGAFKWIIMKLAIIVQKYMWLQTHDYRTNNALYGTLQSSVAVPGRPDD